MKKKKIHAYHYLSINYNNFKYCVWEKLKLLVFQNKYHSSLNLDIEQFKLLLLWLLDRLLTNDWYRKATQFRCWDLYKFRNQTLVSCSFLEFSGNLITLDYSFAVQIHSYNTALLFLPKSVLMFWFLTMSFDWEK